MCGISAMPTFQVYINGVKADEARSMPQCPAGSLAADERRKPSHPCSWSVPTRPS